MTRAWAGARRVADRERQQQGRPASGHHGAPAPHWRRKVPQRREESPQRTSRNTPPPSPDSTTEHTRKTPQNWILRESSAERVPPQSRAPVGELWAPQRGAGWSSSRCQRKSRSALARCIPSAMVPRYVWTEISWRRTLLLRIY